MTDSAPTESGTTDTTTAPRSTAPVDKVRSALLRYRILAWVTGLWLLLLVAELIARYGFGVHSLEFVPPVHGWVYFVYLIFAIDLSIKVRWPIVKIVVTALAGTIPFLSFYVEHIRTREVKRTFGLR